MACKGSTLNLGKEVCKYSFAQVSDTIEAFVSDYSLQQIQSVLRDLDRIAAWLSDCPLEFIGSSILLAHDALAAGAAPRVNLIDFGHVEAAVGAANVGNVVGIRTLQQILQKFVETSQ